MEKIVKNKLYFLCVVVIVVTFIVSVAIKTVFFPMPDKYEIEERARKYVIDKGYDVVLVQADMATMLIEAEDCWFVFVAASKDENEYGINMYFDHITGRVVYENIYEFSHNNIIR